MAEVVFLLAAEMDVQAIYDRLEQQSDGRGDQFLRQLRELEHLLASYPHLGVHVARGIRKLLLPRFDHGIFYTIEGSRIMVAAILDLRRDPAFIRERIGL